MTSRTRATVPWPWQATETLRGTGEDELAAFADLRIQLDERRHPERLEAIERRGRATFLEGAEAQSRAAEGRPMTAHEQARVKPPMFSGGSSHHSTGHTESARYPGQIRFTFEVPLAEIRSDLHTRIAELRRRRGVGQVERSRGTLSGQERISGTRITTAAIARLVDAGWDSDRIRLEYPELEPADIRVALRQANAG